MQDHELPPELPSLAKVLETTGVIVRGFCSLAGLVVLAIGLYLAIQVFSTVYDTAMHPEQSQQLVQQWSDVIGAGSMKIDVGPNQSIDLGRIGGIGVLCSAAFLTGILSCTMMITGAKIVCWTTSERQAVRSIVEYAIQRRSDGGP